MENIRNPMGIIRGAMNDAAAGIGHNRTTEAVVEGSMPVVNGRPTFVSRSDGYESAIVAGTMKIVYAR